MLGFKPHLTDMRFLRKLIAGIRVAEFYIPSEALAFDCELAIENKC